MSNRSVPYFQQKVTHGEVDQWHDDFEDADHNIISDHTDIDHAIWGIFTGYEVVEDPGGPSLKVQVASGVAYDEDGQRIPHTGPTEIDLTTAVPGSNSRYVRVYAAFDQTPSDPRVDGDGNPLNYRQTETVVFSFQLGTPAGSPTKPAIQANKVLLATILIASGATQIFDADISMALDTDPDNPGDIDRQEGGVVIPHGRMATRPVYFEPPPVSPESRINMGGQLLETFGGDIDGGKSGADDGNVIKMLAVQARSPDPGASPSEGHIYTDSSGSLIDIEKWNNYDASHLFTEVNNNQHPWQGFAAVPNVWQIDAVAAGAIGGGAVPSWWSSVHAWRCEINQGAGPYPKYSWPLLCPITGLPNGCKLTRFEFDVVVLVDMTVALNIKYANVAVIRRQGDNVDILTQDPPADFQQAVPGRYAAAEDLSSGGYVIDNTTEEYYAAFWLKTADNGVYNGLRVCGARSKYLIREASGVHT